MVQSHVSFHIFLFYWESGCWESGDWVSGPLPPYCTCAVPCTIKYLSPNGDSKLYYYLNNTWDLSYNLPKTYLQVNFFHLFSIVS